VQWCLNFSERDGIQLALMALPAPASSIEGRPAFQRDACPGIFIHKWDVFTKPSKSVALRNTPCPILFAEDPARTRSALAKSEQAFIRVERGNLLYAKSKQNNCC
jgi:hypothetical protein